MTTISPREVFRFSEQECYGVEQILWDLRLWRDCVLCGKPMELSKQYYDPMTDVSFPGHFLGVVCIPCAEENYAEMTHTLEDWGVYPEAIEP